MIARSLPVFSGLAATSEGAVVVGSLDPTRVANLPGFVGTVGRTSQAVARLGIAAIGIPMIGGGLTGPLLDTIVLAASASASTAAAATTPTAATVTVHLAAAFAVTRFAGVIAEFASWLANGGGPILVSAARWPVVVTRPRRPVVIARPGWPVVVARPWWSVVVAAARRPFRSNASFVVGATVSFAAAFAIGRLVRISCDVSGGGLGRWS